VIYFKYKENQQGMKGGVMNVDKQFQRRITPELKHCSPKQGQVKTSTEKKGRWQIICVEIKEKVAQRKNHVNRGKSQEK
jgi:hypothetical protein